MKALKYNDHARYFLEAAFVASKHATENRSKNPAAFNNFEAVIVGTHHSFAAEILLKGIIYFHKGSHPREHEIKILLDQVECSALKRTIVNNFNPDKHISFIKPRMELALDSYLKNLDKDDEFDKKEIKRINDIRKKYEFRSFNYFLELHSNHFVKMRYACEKNPPPLDMNFTSFLNGELRKELEINLLKLKESN